MAVGWRADCGRARRKQEDQSGGDGELDQHCSNGSREKVLDSGYILKSGNNRISWQVGCGV